MQMIPVKSSNIKSAGYDESTKTMHIEFANGVYQYPGVEIHQFAQMMESPSIGSHFHTHIKPKFSGVKV